MDEVVAWPTFLEFVVGHVAQDEQDSEVLVAWEVDVLVVGVGLLVSPSYDVAGEVERQLYSF